MFNSRNGAADALERVSRRLGELVAREPKLKEGVVSGVGTFCWRTIAGTRRLSMHALAIAVDVNPGRNPYWRHHRRPSDMLARRRDFPKDVLAAFEAEGFIWGGKWAEYDIMHFEYRPELLIKALKSRKIDRNPRLGRNMPRKASTNIKKDVTAHCIKKIKT
jgi:hypothetical protein